MDKTGPSFGVKVSAFGRFFREITMTDKRNQLPTCFRESREPLREGEVREDDWRVRCRNQNANRFDLITSRTRMIASLFEATLPRTNRYLLEAYFSISNPSDHYAATRKHEGGISRQS